MYIAYIHSYCTTPHSVNLFFTEPNHESIILLGEFFYQLPTTVAVYSNFAYKQNSVTIWPTNVIH